MIEIFGKTQCYNCSKAINAAKYYGKPYEYKNIEYKKYRDELCERINIFENDRMPYIFIRGVYIGDYNDFVDHMEGTQGGFGDQPF